MFLGTRGFFTLVVSFLWLVAADPTLARKRQLQTPQPDTRPNIRCSEALAGDNHELIFPKGDHLRKPEEIQELRIATLNALTIYQYAGEYFHFMDYLLPTPWPGKRAHEKAPHFAKWIAEEFLRLDLDVIALQEIEPSLADPQDKRLVLEKFQEELLGDNYYVVMFPGNDFRIQVGYLVKKDLPLYAEAQSFTGALDTRKKTLFSRDLATLQLRLLEDWDGENHLCPPFLTFMNNHFKSMRGRDQSRERARSQVEGAAKVVQEVRKLYDHPEDAGIVLLGDINRKHNINGGKGDDPVIEALGNKDKANLRDVLDDFDPNGFADTYAYFKSGRPPVIPSRLDAIWASSGVQFNYAQVHVWIHPETGEPVRYPPQTKDERKTHPSDHLMVYGTIDFQHRLKLHRDYCGQ